MPIFLLILFIALAVGAVGALVAFVVILVRFYLILKDYEDHHF